MQVKHQDARTIELHGFQKGFARRESTNVHAVCRKGETDGLAHVVVVDHPDGGGNSVSFIFHGAQGIGRGCGKETEVLHYTGILGEIAEIMGRVAGEFRLQPD